MALELILGVAVLISVFAYFFPGMARGLFDVLATGKNIIGAVLVVAAIYFGATAGSLFLLTIALVLTAYVVLLLFFEVDLLDELRSRM